MNADVFKIISQLVKQLLHEDEVVDNEEELINSLQQKGYDLVDINQAFEFVFSASEEDSEQELFKSEFAQDEGFKHRVLNGREKSRFNLNVQGIIIKLTALDLISEEELEQSIMQAVTNYNAQLDTLDFWEILEEVVAGEFRLTMITEKIPEFKVINAGQQEQIH